MYAWIPESVLYKNGNSSTTATLRKRLAATGEFEIRTAPKYTKSPDNNSRGDILLYEGHHVAVQIEDGKNVKKTTPAPTGKAYPGVFPVFSDVRDDYRKGDGIDTLTNYPTQIKRAQMLINWINTGKADYDADLAGSIKVDGRFGGCTEKAVKAAQKRLGVKEDGVFGASTLAAAKRFRR
jgi:peptidoglycan hydrolase-like protein with peptidoglycan-binding domain